MKDETLKKYQQKIKDYVEKNRLKLLFGISDDARLLVESELIAGEYYPNKSTLSFKYKQSECHLSVKLSLQETRVEIRMTNAGRSLFAWSIKKDGKLNPYKTLRSNNFTIEDLIHLQELINPVLEEIQTAAQEISRANKEEGLEIIRKQYLNQQIESVELDQMNNAYFVLSDGSKIQINEKLNQAVKAMDIQKG